MIELELPEGFDRIILNGLIGSEDSQAMFNSLADKHPVKGIFVNIRQVGK